MPGVVHMSGGLAVVALLAGCLPEGIPINVAPGRGADSGNAPLCSPGIFAGIVGEPVSAAAAVPSPKRIIRPGESVTTDYDAARTNVEVDDKDLILRIFCG